MYRRTLHPVFVLFAAGALAAALTGSRALAVGPPLPGPDLVAGDIPDCHSYGSYDNIIFAYDLGTTSCNLGNVNIRWQGSTPNHPVIGTNVYRLTPSGHFEQIGMAWVKHSFYATAQNLCGTCNHQGTGNVLGVGCSDPYDGGINSDQGGLGPRSEINASTGVFPFVTPHTWPATVNTNSRLLQINAADVSPPPSTSWAYFGEAIYVSSDDAAAGINLNNASWRSITINAADTINHAMAVPMGGATHRSEPALFAWKAADPTVRLAAFDVPADGRFWLGHTATDNGNGTWHYEYALLNLTSDRSGASFTVPIPPGTTITNAAFHAPVYHSGEIYSNTPWTITVASGSISSNFVTFSVPQTFAQNANASALRWGTLYNFRFDASAAPGSSDGAISVGLFKPGGLGKPDSFSLAARTPGGASAAAPVPINDECAHAAALSSGENRTSNLGATDSTPAIACAPISADLWFTYTYTSYALPAGCPGNITFDTCGSEVPTTIAVYTASSCPTADGSEAACATQGSALACTGPAPAASVSIPAVEGMTYRVRVGSATSARGNIVVNVTPPFCIPANGACCSSNGSCTIAQGASSCFTGTFLPGYSVCTTNPCPLPPPPVNDQCSGAIVIGDNALGYPTLAGTNFQADNTVNDVCSQGATGSHDVWYTYTPAQSSTVVVDTCIVPASGTALDTLVSIHSGSCTGTMVACNDDDSSGLCSGGPSRISTSLTAGTTYYIRVSGYGPATGDFVLRVTGGGGVTPPQTGACCWGSTCSITTSAACTGTNYSFVALGAACNPAGNNVTPCCRADFNRSGSLTVQDVFDFLNAWFLSSPSSDFNGGGIIVQDVFDFLNAWFLGC